ncbi:ras guanine nucleotide exchange factor domain-containing protein [Crepidotus variabilis]|uniref:Ras guanine nucleotide exchange factor domain-containing protein n=1 Tax=Crepidotus variabilis TaxID=179855 RepID=A0A9P6ER28_9AGAR|nr:ras guanine nucleotide exchange factor domain-containing protein [Crepidotus variabilis]
MAAIATQLYSHPISHSYTATSSSLTASSSHIQQSHSQEEEEDEIQDDPQLSDEQFIPIFCRALYDYDAQDPSALSFRRDDIIEILTRQASGWWDGLLGEERGWFPSNYVTLISEEEAEAAFAQADGESQLAQSTTASTVTGANPQQQSDTVDLSHALSRGSQSDNEEWLENEMTAYSTVNQAATRGATSNAGQSSDFWMPEVTPDGQIYYVNTQTGQRSRYLPQEAEDDVSDGDLAGLASQSVSRSGTSAFGYTEPAEASSESENDARRDPSSGRWVKKLAEDGVRYYYLNTLDGRVQWTVPETGYKDATTSGRSNASSSRGDTSRLSVYSDDSDVQTFDHLPTRSRKNTDDSRVAPPSVRPAPTNQEAVMELTSSERIAKSLQQALEPPAPDAIGQLSNIARNAIKAVVDNIHSGGVVRQPEDDRKMDELVYAAVMAVRNLLYIAGAPSAAGSVPESSRDARNSSQASLKPAQRKVTATLSRLVLSARAMQYDSGSSLGDTLSRIETDADELERAVLSFVTEAQRNERQQLSKDFPKRLRGVFTTSNIGLGLVGGGRAGSWKGFGYVAPDTDFEMPSKVLGTEVISEIFIALSHLQECFGTLGKALRVQTDNSVHQVRIRVQELVSQISSFLSLIADVHVARHVDIDGIRQGEDAGVNDHYSHSVESARKLVRQLEAIVQSVYDDSSALLLTSQGLHESDIGLHRGEQEAQYDLLDRVAASLGANLALVKQSFDGLLSVGHEQADVAQGDYNGSIDWRMSRISAINDHFNGLHNSIRPAPDAYGSDNEDVVDIDFAFNRPGLRKQKSSADASFDSYQTLANTEPALPPARTSEASADVTLVAHSPPDGREYDDTAQSIFEEEVPPKPTRAPASSNKLHKLLGDEYADKVAADLQPWFLRPNYSPSDIVIEPDGAVRGGTITALVERLTAHEQADPYFQKAFLMTYKSFTSLDELFTLLIERFHIQAPENLEPAEREQWGKLKQHVIQMRVLNTLKSMIIDEGVLEKEDLYILDRMKEFITSDEVSKLAAAKQLMILIERASLTLHQQRGQGEVKMLVTTQTTAPPPVIMPKSGKKLKLLDIDPLELARQLTILESGLYQKIKPTECLNRSREGRAEVADNISNSIQTSNRIADWVADSILSKEDSRRRAQVIKHLIVIADRCRNLNNFSSMAAITSGLNTPPIRRLKRSWEQVNQRFMAQFEACNNVIDSNKNFTKYKQVLAHAAPPCVPFIGPFLTNLEFIQVGNKDTLPGGLVNFKKRQKINDVINDIQRWQSQAYNLQSAPLIQNYLSDSLNQFNDTKASSDHFWALSLDREPREREDEKMARLLQESGFL